MFDFDRWRDWLKVEAEKLATDGFAMAWLPQDKQLRSTCVQGKGRCLIGSFRNFENGFVDYEVFSENAGRFLADEAMIPVSNENFAAVFGNFREALGLQP